MTDCEKTQKTIYAVRKLLAEQDQGKLERLLETVNQKIESDDEAYRNKSQYLLRAYLEEPKVADDLLMALCGWRLKSLLTFAGLIEDDEGLLMK